MSKYRIRYRKCCEGVVEVEAPTKIEALKRRKQAIEDRGVIVPDSEEIHAINGGIERIEVDEGRELEGIRGYKGHRTIADFIRWFAKRYK